MKKWGWVLLMVLAAARVSADLWETDYDKALKRAAEQSRYVLLDFTGSDWCRFCIMLDREVFSKKAFQQYAKENLVAVKLDFPQHKKLPAALKKQNDVLARQYRVRGYPTIILLSPSGEIAARLGYQRGGAEAYVETLREAIRRHEAQTAPAKAD